MAPGLDDILKASIKQLKDAGVDTPQLDAQLMMARALGRSRLDVITHPEIVPTDLQSADFQSMLERRISRCPLAYILGVKEFFCIELDIEPGVLVPRPETEVLVEECIKRTNPASIIADVGAGSGAIAVALAVNLPEAKIYTTDVSPTALKVAHANVEKQHLADRVYVVAGNLLDPLIEMNMRFDVVVSNPPYIPTGVIETLEPEVRLYEPKEALDGGADGLDVYRKLFPQSVQCLNNKGFIAVEIGAGQAAQVSNIAKDAGLRSIEVVPDLAGIERIVIARK